MKNEIGRASGNDTRSNTLSANCRLRWSHITVATTSPFAIWVLAAITPPTSDRVVAYLPESMIHTAEVGMSAFVTAMTNVGPNRQAYRGVVVGLSAAVDEAPLRYRDVPTYPAWGRGIVIALQEPAALTPGEAVLIALGK